ncbi:MAG TPA: hypothetical protein VMB49_07915 [Acidobacteriaceae bacterium]|nr:hypothetical protein [Acidobacteriaceae bacterium]
MNLPKSLFHASLLGSLLLSPIVAFSSSTNAHSKFIGVYVSQAQNGGRDGAFMNLSLGPDGSATVTEDPGTGTTTTLFGHWVDAGSQITVTFDAQANQPTEPAMAFALGHDGLQAVSWNHATWGKVNPPPMRKGGAKVKSLYWFSENP